MDTRVRAHTKADASYRLTIMDKTDGEIVAIAVGRTARDAFDRLAGRLPHDMLRLRWLTGMQQAASNRRALSVPGGRSFYCAPLVPFAVEIERLA